MFGLLSRLLLFLLLIWLARSLLQGLWRIFAHTTGQPRVKQPPASGRDEVHHSADPARSKLNLSKDDVIDVPYTDVDPKR